MFTASWHWQQPREVALLLSTKARAIAQVLSKAIMIAGLIQYDACFQNQAP